LRELIRSFPAWVRGAALAGAATALILAAVSIAHMSIRVEDGHFALSLGTSKVVTGAPARSSEEIEKFVQNAIVREREKIENEYRAQMAEFKQQLAAEYKTQLQAVSAEQQVKIRAVQASLRTEIARVNRQNRNIRPFFDSDEYADLWATGR